MKTLIEAAKADDVVHARLLNTFSFLEYLGFRKIVKTQSAATLSLEVMQHALEEGRHAKLLKTMAIAKGGGAYDRYSSSTTLALGEARAYFDGLEKACTEATYDYVTWLVETRALVVYQAYDAAFPGTRIRGLLREEVGHLDAVTARVDAAKLEALRCVEEGLYARLVTALRADAGRTAQVSAHA